MFHLFSNCSILFINYTQNYKLMKRTLIFIETLIAIGIGVCIGISPLGRIPAVRLFLKAVTGG